MAPRLRAQLVTGAVAVAIVLAVDSSGLAGADVSVVVDDSAQLVAGGLAAACCAWTARRASGVERTWRLLVAVGMTGWTLGQLIWSYYQVFARTPLPSPSLADLGYLTLPPFALLALLAIASDGMAYRLRRTREFVSVPRTRLMLVLDGCVVVGSLLILTWYTALGAVVKAGAPTTLAFIVAIAYPVTDVMLVVIVLLLIATRTVAAPVRPQLTLLGLGLVGLSLSDSIFAYLVASGAQDMPPAANAGFIAGPLLVAVAALTGGPAGGRHEHLATDHPSGRDLLLPYVPLVGIGLLTVVREATGHPLSSVELYLGSAVVALAVARQMITLLDNTMLLGQVTHAQQRLHYQAFHDPLTGLANRALFHRGLGEAMTPQSGTRPPAALFFIDLDGFKAVNDSLGHSVGDQVLQVVAARLRSCVRDTDLVARLGGDEFAVLVGADVGSHERLAQRIHAALHAPMEVSGHVVSIGASIGVALPGEQQPTDSAEALLKRADAAMYAGKRRKPAASIPGRSSIELAAALAHALASGADGRGLDVHYQPIVRMADREPVAIEALARWTHPLRGPVAAAEFVAVAEQHGLVAALDDFVLDRAGRQLAEGAAGGHLAVHVNVSASRLGGAGLEASVERVLRRYGLDPARLVLEITESRPVADVRTAAESARRLARIGVQLAVDDFGTGHNSLILLRSLPVSVVKLDGNLTQWEASPPGRARAAAVCRSVLALAADLGVTVVAEAIETAEQAADLAELGYLYGQGYLYGRPAPPDSFHDPVKVDTARVATTLDLTSAGLPVPLYPSTRG